jgi:hypothetical protein
MQGQDAGMIQEVRSRRRGHEAGVQCSKVMQQTCVHAGNDAGM